MIYHGEESRHSHYTQDAFGLEREIHINHNCTITYETASLLIVTECSILWICPILTINKNVFFIFKKKLTNTV